MYELLWHEENTKTHVTFYSIRCAFVFHVHAFLAALMLAHCVAFARVNLCAYIRCFTLSSFKLNVPPLRAQHIQILLLYFPYINT